MRKWQNSWLTGDKEYYRGLHLIMLVLIVVGVITIVSADNGLSPVSKKATPVRIIGEYSTDDGMTFMPFSDFSDIDIRRVQHLILKGHFSDSIPDGDKLFMFIDFMDVRLYIDGVLAYQNDLDDSGYWDGIVAEGLTKEKEVIIDMSMKTFIRYPAIYGHLVNRLYYGEAYGLLEQVIRTTWWKIVLAYLILAIGIGIVVNALQLAKENTGRIFGITSCGLAVIWGAIATFLDPDFISLLLPWHKKVLSLDSVAQVFCILFTVIYLQRYVKRVHHLVIIRILILLSCFSAAFLMLSHEDLPGKWREIATVVPVVWGTFLVAIYSYILTRALFDDWHDKRLRLVTISSIVLTLSLLLEMIVFLYTCAYVITAFRLGLLFFAVTQFFVIVSENIARRKAGERAALLENELIQNRVDIMRSQIQPHFMFNALGTIRALCTKNPEEARNAMDFFAKYLRANMESLDNKNCIPFSKELEHVESYLYIEKLRFGELLDIKYEIETEDFMIPPMVVQTLAENAVKHGLLAKKEGGTLAIRSREINGAFEVQIEDDGIGFYPNRQFNESEKHVGIANSKERLEKMCNGRLEIRSVLNKGTVVTITIPKVV